MSPELAQRIRECAFELSARPDRAHLGDLDHWLDAERNIRLGLSGRNTAHAGTIEMPGAIGAAQPHRSHCADRLPPPRPRGITPARQASIPRAPIF